MARSACANVRRRGDCPVTRGLSGGSASASASGWRASSRRNKPSSVGGAAVWITGSLLGRLRLLPPGFRQISRERGGCWPFFPVPAGGPLFRGVVQGNCIEAGHQGAVERPYCGHEFRVLARRQHRRDQGVDGGILRAHVIAGALIVRRFASPVEQLLIAGRERLVPA